MPTIKTAEYLEAQEQAFEACSQAAKWIMQEKYDFARMKLEEAAVLAKYAGNTLEEELARQEQIRKEIGGEL